MDPIMKEKLLKESSKVKVELSTMMAPFLKVYSRMENVHTQE